MRAAQQQRRCAFATDQSTYAAMTRRTAAGEYVSPYQGLYANRTHWQTLTECERSAYMVRALHCKKPHWVFTGYSALDVQGITHSRSSHEGAVWIADHQRNAHKHNSPRTPLRRIHLPSDVGTRIIDGIPVTAGAVTVAVSIAHLPFMHALPLVDDALRKGATVEQLEECCRQLRVLTPALRTLLHCGNPKSESGGESIARAAIRLLGFAEPQLQVEFPDLRNSGHMIRVDMLWRLPDGRMIVLEFDGVQKYLDPTMTKHRDVRILVQTQGERDESIRRSGVTTIVHCFYEDVVNLRVFDRLLRNAGVPWVGVPNELQGELRMALQA